MAKFIVPTLVDLLNRRESPCALLFVLASWLHYLRGSDENGRTLSICDPSLGYLQTFIDAGSSDARLAFSVRPIFGEVAFTHPQLVSEVQMYLDELHTNGVRATIKHLLSKAQSR
jgi:mannitol-1-phosphate/altronate dehydrogenase